MNPPTTRNLLSLMVLFAAACRGSTAPTDMSKPEDAGPLGGTSGDTGGLKGERFWLQQIGMGKEQTRRVCDRGASDPVARALCAVLDSPIRSLRELYARVGLPLDDHGHGQIGLASQSSGLSFQAVSQLNPRFVTTTVNEFRAETLTLNNVVVAAFSRGDQLVELAAHDTATGTLNFYLFVFQQACGDTCSAQNLLSARVEKDWVGWTLYGQQDLEDTPLDCLSCHRPGGPTTRTRLLMRDQNEPWFRWFLHAGMDSDCPDGKRPIKTLPDLRASFAAAHAAEGEYAGMTLDALQHADGHILFTLLVLYGRLLMDGTTQEPFAMDTRRMLDEWRCHAKTDVWQTYQKQQQQSGLPVPYYGFDKLDANEAAAALNDYPAFLAKNTDKDPLALLRSLASSEAQAATGAVPPQDADGARIARMMCGRCHDARTPASLKRARFLLDAIDRVPSASVRENRSV